MHTTYSRRTSHLIHCKQFPETLLAASRPTHRKQTEKSGLTTDFPPVFLSGECVGRFADIRRFRRGVPLPFACLKRQFRSSLYVSGKNGENIRYEAGNRRVMSTQPRLIFQPDCRRAERLEFRLWHRKTRQRPLSRRKRPPERPK